MNKEFVLDLGIGTKPNYTSSLTAKNEIRVGLDIDEESLRVLKSQKWKFRKILPVRANAENLPFDDSAFKRIETILPNSIFADQGLQNRSGNSNGWYAEFSRVLKPLGNLIIFGGVEVKPIIVQHTSRNFFEWVEAKPLTLDEYATLRTSYSDLFYESYRLLMNIYSRDNNSGSPFNKITLRNKKIY